MHGKTVPAGKAGALGFAAGVKPAHRQQWFQGLSKNRQLEAIILQALKALGLLTAEGQAAWHSWSWSKKLQ